MSAQSDGAAPQKGRSPAIKLGIVAAMTIFMAIPLFIIALTLTSREISAAGAAGDIASSWGGNQTIAGLYILVPYTVQELNQDGTRTVTAKYVVTKLPTRLNIGARARTEIRSRGIYDATVYTADVTIDADFAAMDLSGFPPDAIIRWSDASAVIALSDARGLNSNPVLNVNGRMIPFEPGAGPSGASYPAVHARLPIRGPAAALKMQTRLSIRGTSLLSFAPLGRDTTIAMNSGWPSPSFFGAFLPTERHLYSNGFSAAWNVPAIARGYDALYMGGAGLPEELRSSAFGVKFYQPVDYYQLVERSLKYGILVVGLTFLTFFVFELVAGANLHAIQYAMIGAAQVLFYLLLLSISEQLGFDWAYGLGAVGIVGLTTLYGISALGGVPRAALLGVVLSTVYGGLYVLLQVEDYALLFGSLFLFATLSATMYLTRKIDWHRGFNLAHG